LASASLPPLLARCTFDQPGWWSAARLAGLAGAKPRNRPSNHACQLHAHQSWPCL